MMGISETSPYRRLLMKLINAINCAVPLSNENQVLLVIKLDTERKIIRFNDWIKSSLENGNFLIDEYDIVGAAVRISREEDNNAV